MKKLLLVFSFWLMATWAIAQITLSPEKPNFTEEVVLIFDATQGNAALKDHQGDIYAHTGLITGESTHPNDWKKVVADWGMNWDKLKLRRTGDNTYELRFKIADLYGIPATGGNVTALCFVFRNEDGSKVAKAKGDQDIFYFFKKPTFQKQPEVLANSETPVPEWSKYASIYEVNIRQYTPEGTINAFAEHLPRLRELGVDILWFMPIQPIGVKERKGTLGSYYSIQDYTAVNPEFGTLEDFKALVHKAHGLGFKVILDWVANHTSRDHVWVESHPTWYNYDDKGNIIAPYDWTDVADLNYEMYYMRQAMTEDMMFWVKEADIDGFRCDVAGEVPFDFWEDTRRDLNAQKEVWLIAEDGSKLWLLNRAFNANYGWGFHHLMNEVAQGKQKASELIVHLEALEKAYPNGTYAMHFTTNHDENSWQGTVFERLGEGHKAFAALIFTVPGMPLIYSGQEVGLNKRLKFFEKDPISWSDKTLTPFYTRLNALKAENPALWNGTAGGKLEEIKHDQPDAIVAFARAMSGNKVVSIFNFSKKNQSVNLQVAQQAGIYKDFFTGELVTLTKRTQLKLDAWAFKILIFQSPLSETRRTFQSFEKDEHGFYFHTSDGTIAIAPYTEGALQVEFIPVGEQNPPSYALSEKAKKKVLTRDREIYVNDQKIVVQIEGFVITVTKEPFQITYAFKQVPLISEELGFFDDGTKRGFRFQLDPTEQLTGGGERAGGINRRGKRLKLYNQPSYGYEEEKDLMYYSMPVVLSSKKYMIFFDNGASGYLDLGASETNILQFEAVGGRMSYCLVAAEKWEDLATNFTAFTGRQPMLPRWALGNIASRMGYHTQAEVESVAAQYAKDRIPLDAVVLDLFWFGPDIKGHLGNLEWDKNAFPEPEKMMSNLKAKGIKTVLITEPFILRNTKKYEEVIAKKLVGTDRDGNPYHFDFYFGNSTLLDIFKPETKDWFWEIYKKHTLTGVDGWWGDLGEPEVHPNDLLHINGRGELVHNLYGQEWAKMIFEGFAKDFPQRRPMILMRSGFVGSQRYGMVPWSGDVNRSWGGLKPQVEIALTMSLQGLGYMHSDLGGFAGDYKDAELYLRWLQYGVFQPIYRTHAQEAVPAEPIFWDDATKNIARKFIELRYRLLPYNYTLSFQNARIGVPLMRPLFYLEDNPELFTDKTNYLWGDNFLVSPVTDKGATTQKVYLPKGTKWFDFWTDKTYEGGQNLEVATTLATIPVFVKAGAFVPMSPIFQTTKDYTSAQLDLHYYHDASVTQSTGMMYEDDGETMGAYEAKRYELLRFDAAYASRSLAFTLKPERYDYEGRPASRTIRFIVHTTEKPTRVLVNGEPIEVFTNSTNQTLEFSVEVKEKVVKAEVQF